MKTLRSYWVMLGSSHICGDGRFPVYGRLRGLGSFGDFLFVVGWCYGWDIRRSNDFAEWQWKFQGV